MLLIVMNHHAASGWGIKGEATMLNELPRDKLRGNHLEVSFVVLTREAINTLEGELV
ncbi:MAG: hypothetical protein NT178_05715 [Proteobacteria bacterium]|nr:hypothetical protein [Pseudomonadota bacterium]